MKLWKISQDKIIDFDMYYSAVVAAETEEMAKATHPNGFGREVKEEKYSSWVGSPDDIACEYLGEAKDGTEAGVICAEFNAG